MGMRIYSDVAVDDFSLSPECFGLNIPPEHLQGYNYWDPPRVPINKKPQPDFENKSGLIISYYYINNYSNVFASSNFILSKNITYFTNHENKI
jgi:hypothetical protein